MSAPHWEVNTWGEETTSLNSLPSCCTLLLKQIQPLALMTSGKSSRVVNNPRAQIQSNHSMRIHIQAGTRTSQRGSKAQDI